MSTKAKPNIEKAIGEAIRAQRLAIGWSQEELGFRANLHRTYIGVIERGEKSISVHNLAAVASTLGLKASELLVRAGY